MEDIETSLSLTINDISLNVSDSVVHCIQSDSQFHAYTYAASATPVVQSLSQQRAIAGDRIVLQLKGLSTMAEDNILVFGGNTNITCSSPSPAILSTVSAHPSSSILTAATMYSDSLVECTVLNLPAGIYRPVLHVAGRGWGHSDTEDTLLTVHPQITSAPSIVGGSLRGGLSLSISTRGLSESDVLRTRVKIGNTPCRVEEISSQGVLTCFTQAAVDDGYSSLIDASSPLAYWSFQSDYHTPDGSYLVSDGLSFFRSGGSLAAQANASVHGMVSRQHIGISGNNNTDQSIEFTEAAFLQVPALKQLVAADGFAIEFWMKLNPSWSPHYRIVINASANCNTVACGFIVVLNPCNQLEFWLASGEVMQERSPEDTTATRMEDLQPFAEDSVEASAESASGELLEPNQAESGSGEVSGESLDTTPIECPLITDDSQCPSACNGYSRVREHSSLLLPTGLWHVIRSNQVNASDWYHVYMNWQATETSDFDSTTMVVSGTQEMSVNGDFYSKNSTYLQSNGRIEIGGTSSLPLRNFAVWSPFRGYLDEMAIYSKPLQTSEIASRIQYGTRDIQPVWLSIEGFDGVGTGSIPNVMYPVATPPLSPVVIDWEAAVDMELTNEDPVTLQFEWTM